MLPLLFLAPLLALDVHRAGDHTRIDPVAAPCENLIFSEPVVVYQVTGSTLLGAYDLELILNSNGIVRLSSGVLERSQLAFIGPGAANAVSRRMEALGGMLECDQDGTYSDAPIHTLTVLRGFTDARAHSASWYAPSAPQALMQMELDQLITDLFPEF